MYQDLTRPEALFRHVFGDLRGYLVTFTGRQARLDDPEASSRLVDLRQRSWRYPEHAPAASGYLIDQAQRECDAYYGVHLYRERGNRLASNALGTVLTLWLDEDEGYYPDSGPEPTAVIHTSRRRRHLYWRLTHPVAIEFAVKLNQRIADIEDPEEREQEARRTWKDLHSMARRVASGVGQ